MSAEAISYDHQRKLFVMPLPEAAVQVFTFGEGMVGHSERAALAELQDQLDVQLRAFEKDLLQRARRQAFIRVVLIAVLAVLLLGGLIATSFRLPFATRLILSITIPVVSIAGGAYLVMDRLGYTGGMDNYQLVKFVMLEKYIRENSTLIAGGGK